MFQIVEHNGVLTIRKASKKLSADTQRIIWMQTRGYIEELRRTKAARKDRREYARHVNKQNRMTNARLRAAGIK